MRRWLVLCAACAACGDSRGAPAIVVAPPAPPPLEAARAPAPDVPTLLGDGLTAERHGLAAVPATGGAAYVDIVRADPRTYRVRVLSAHDGTSRTAPDWRDVFHLAAVINAGMFHDSGAPVGLIVEGDVELSADNAKMGGFFAFDPRAASDAPAIVTGRDCAGFDLAALRRRYRSIVQSYRLLDCDGHALPWQDPKQYSAAAIGVDRAGRVVLVHARAAVTMTELSTALASLDLAGALFLEGGPEASLVARGDRGALERLGSYETRFVENDGNTAFWPLPNVIGLERR